MDRRSFLGALCAAPVALPIAAKSLSENVGSAAMAQYVDRLDPLLHGSSWAVRLDDSGYVTGLTQGERVTLIADQFRIVLPGDAPVPALKVAGDQIVANPGFPWDQFFGG